jgi:hypothetical protein
MKRLGRAHWQRAIAKFERSALTQEAFCEANGLNVGTFRSWLYRLRREQTASEPSFVEVVSSAPPASTDACVVRAGEVELRFAERPDATYLGALLRAAASETR